MQNPHSLLCLVCIILITSRAWWPCPPGRCCSPPPPPWSPSSAWSRQTERVLSLGSRRSGWGTLRSIIPHSTTFLLIFTQSSTVSHIVQYSSNFSRWPPFRRSECGRQSSVEVLSAPLAVTWVRRRLRLEFLFWPFFLAVHYSSISESVRLFLWRC